MKGSLTSFPTTWFQGKECLHDFFLFAFLILFVASNNIYAVGFLELTITKRVQIGNTLFFIWKKEMHICVVFIIGSNNNDTRKWWPSSPTDGDHAWR
jgi:hypothetical protein